MHRPAPKELIGRVSVPEGEALLSHVHLVDLIGTAQQNLTKIFLA